MARKVYVVGVGISKFERPGANRLKDYPDIAKESIVSALKDAQVDYSKVQHATMGYVYGDSTAGQKCLYEVGLTGIPVINVNNNCATGSTALLLAKQLIEGGLYDCTLAVGFDKMERGALTTKYKDRIPPMQTIVDIFYEKYGMGQAPITAQLFGAAGKEHRQKFGTTSKQFAQIAEKNRRHALNNECAQLREAITADEILKEPEVYDVITKSQCCPTSNGSAAVILASEEFVRKNKLEANAVEILAIEMYTDTKESFADGSALNLCGVQMTKSAAKEAFKKSKLSPNDIQVIELHDCFSTNELITYEALGLCPEGFGGKLVDSGDNTYGGKWVVNPSGGLLAKGHPLGATGVAQCVELCLQLRNLAGKRQVPNAIHALQHNIGLGGAAVVAIYKHGYPNTVQRTPMAKL